ncbi:S41 family peptidase [Thermomonas fusca]|uniref:S41 family peptidase n=1 Tax=Thermomonas fusca TaxID=215690 RepID=UPI0009FE8D2C|nr:S41 family peptidase [Thermomonas fusca]
MLKVALTILLLAGGVAWNFEARDDASTAQIRWNPISGGEGFRVLGEGDPSDERGASVTIDSTSTAKASFGGAMASLDVARFRGQELVLAGQLEVTDGPGNAAIWIRADGNGRRPAFSTSATMPVIKGSKEQRKIWIYAPEDTNNLVVGAIVKGEAKAKVSQLTVRALPQRSLSSATAKQVLLSILSLVEKNALNASKLDVPALRNTLITEGLEQSNPLEGYARGARVLEGLQDGHSFLLTPKDASFYRSTGTRYGLMQSSLIHGVGYINVPGFRGTALKQTTEYANEICSKLAQLNAKRATGWVVDLRQNNGGNMWPMLDGLQPLLGRGSYGSFRDRNGNETPLVSKGKKRCQTTVPSNARVAVLIGRNTASSGEAIAIAFSGRPNTRTFGSATAGLSTANSTYALPGGGTLVLTTGVAVDRLGRLFPAGLKPDESISDQGTADQTLGSAIAWVRSDKIRKSDP